MNPKSARLGLVLLTAFAMIGVAFWWRGSHHSLGKRQTNHPVSAGTTRASTAPTNQIASTAAAQAVMSNEAGQTKLFAWFRKRPFAVARESTNYEWTAENGKNTNVILQLAHNRLEYERMVAENDTIYRRELVYHRDAFSLQAQAARMGQPVSRVTLPGLDGQELHAQISRTEIEAGGDRGTFTGHLVDRPGSMVTVAFLGGREAFTVISPQDGIYLTAEPREPGELVVKSINPETYGGIVPESDAVVIPEKN